LTDQKPKKRFRVAIRGEKLLFDLDGEHQLFGMEAICFVTAVDKLMAGKSALATLLQAPAVKERLVDGGQCRANYDLLEVAEVSRFEYFRRKRSEKLEFYLMEAETP